MTNSLPVLQKPWYSEGLRFSCTGCGKCCTGSPGYTWVTVDEIVAIAEYLQLSIDQFASRYLRQIDDRYSLKENLITHDCVFLKDTKCQIYPVRPTQCKTFPWWIENLKSEEEWQQAALRCEGINHPEAELVSKETIESVLPDHGCRS